MGKSKSSAKKAYRAYGTLAGTLREHAKLALQEPQEMKERRMAAESAYSQIRSSLGRPETYEGEGVAGPPGGAGDLYKDSDVRVASEGILKKYKGGIPQTLDPDKVAAATISSPEFRIASRLTAQAEQMLKKEGPLWEEMQKSTIGPIMEGTSALMRDQAEVLRKQYARGGAARNRSTRAMQEIRNIEQANFLRQQNLWKANKALNEWSIDNARKQLTFNESWASNAAGVRDKFNDAMDAVGEFFVKGALPIASGLETKATEAEVQYHTLRANFASAKKSKLMGYAIGAAGLVGAFFTGGATLPLALGALGGAIGGPDMGEMGRQAGGIPQLQSLFGSQARTGSSVNQIPGSVGSNVITSDIFGGF